MLTYEDMLLVQLAEECNEVSQRIAKCLRFGMDDVQAGTDDKGRPHKSNRERLANEVADMMTLRRMCCEAGLLPDSYAESVHDIKRQRVYEYMDLSIALGRMEPKVPYCRAKLYKSSECSQQTCEHQDIVPLQHIGEMEPHVWYCNRCGKTFDRDINESKA
jgi:hypothetical protein